MLFGDQTVEWGRDYSSAGHPEAFPFSNSTNGTTASISVYVESSNKATKLYVGVYANKNGHPGSLVVSGSLSSPRAASWNNVRVPSAAVSSGRTYWVAVLGTGGQLRFRDRNGGPCTSENSAQTGQTSLPSTWTPGPQYNTCPISAYVNGYLTTQPPALPAPPSNTALPTISGTPTQGQTLSTSNGSWSGSPSFYSYQWEQCDSSGANCTTITGATRANYTVQAADVGDTIQVVVTATNAGGSASQTSAKTGTVTTSGCASPLSVTDRWYSACSAFNEPIPAGTPYAPNDASVIANMGNYCGGSCIQPGGGGNTNAYIASSSTPTVTVNAYPNSSCTPGSVQQVPIPSGVVGPFEHNSNDNEARLGIFVSDTGVEWNLWKTRGPGSIANTYNASCGNNPPGVWSASIAHKADPVAGTGGWNGLANESYSSRASGVSDGAGTIRPRDTQMPAGSTWNHALVLSWPGNLATHVYPATASDGPCTDTTKCVPEGARFQLDPSFDCTTTTLLSYEWERQMCRTLQVYGMIVVDTSCRLPCSGGGIASESGWSVQQANADNGGVLGYRFPYEDTGYLALPLTQYLHVIDWTKWTGNSKR